MAWDKKKQLETLMKRRKEGGGEVIAGPAPMKVESVKSEDGVPDGRHMAAQDMLMAFHEKSPEKLMGAMINFMDMHSAMSNKPEPK